MYFYYFFFFFNDTATTEIYTLSLHDALPIAVDVQTGIDSTVAQQALQGLAGIVVADDRQQRGVRAERRRVAGDVGSAAEAVFLALDLDHRHWRLRRNPADVAEPVTVEHHVADDQQ